MGRPPCCDKSNVKRGLWTPEEDAKILHYVSTNGPGNWTSVPKKAGLKRCGKSCRLRWTNYLRPDLKHANFTFEEEELIVNLHAAIGSRWSLIATQLPGRTDNDVKNHWNTKLRKKLFRMGIDPVTHKPFSQILADYGNIGGLPKIAGTRVGGSLNRDLRQAFMPKTESSAIPHLDGYSTITTHSMLTTTNPTFHDNNPFNNNINPSFELLAQLQAIKLATEASSLNCTNQETNYYRPHFFSEGSGSSSSSSCSNFIQEHAPKDPLVPIQSIAPCPSFSWSEFLLEDPGQTQLQAQESHEFSSTDSSIQITQNEFNSAGEDHKVEVVRDVQKHYNMYDNDTQASYHVMQGGEASGGASASTYNSFIKTILDRDSEMLWEFPNLLEEPFY